MKSTPKKLPDGRWKIRIYPFHGSKSCRQFTGSTKKECLDWANREYSRITQDPNYDDQRLLSDLVEIWWSNYGINLRSGKDRYNMLMNFVDSVGDMYWRSFTARHFLEWRSTASMNPNSKNHIHTYIKTLFTKLSKNGFIYLQKNPLDSVEKLKFQATQMRYLSSLEIKAILNEAQFDNYELYLMISLGLQTGFRWGEIQNLKLSNLVNGQIQLTKTKGYSFRSVPVEPNFYENLRLHLEQNKAFKDRYKAFALLIKNMGIDLPNGQLTHVLRHTFASHFLMNGGDIVSLQKILGHTDIKTTMRYAHLAPDFINKVLIFNPIAKNTNQV